MVSKILQGSAYPDLCTWCQDQVTTIALDPEQYQLDLEDEDAAVVKAHEMAWLCGGTKCDASPERVSAREPKRLPLYLHLELGEDEVTAEDDDLWHQQPKPRGLRSARGWLMNWF